MRKILKYIIIFIGLIIIFNVLLLNSSLFPSILIENNVRESAKILKEQGNYYRISNFFETINNNYTDVLMINEAYSINSKNPVFSYMSARKNFKAEVTKHQLTDTYGELVSIGTEYYDPSTELIEFLDGNIDTSIEYARYWHGYLTILRPLLAIFNYSGIRIVLFILTTISIISLIVLICKKINILSGIIYAIGLLSISIFIVTNSINECLIFLVAFISSIILLLKKNTKKNIGIFFFVVGSISNFIDLLTAPLVTLGITAITYFLIIQKQEKNANIKEYIIDIIKIGISWSLGYGFTWISKWLITEILYGRPIISQAIEQALFRSELPTYNGKAIFSPIDVITRNMEYLSYNVIFIILTIAILYLIAMLIRNHKKDIDFKENIKKCFPYIIIFFFPIIWYLVIKQHSYTHMTFTYRLFIISIICILIVTSKILEEKTIKQLEEK